jgi:gliding motility-associated-like protein
MKILVIILLYLISFSVSSQQTIELCPDSLKTFTYSSDAGVNGIYEWNLGNQTYNGKTVTFTWDELGTYIMFLRFESLPGCSDTISYVVNVKPCSVSSIYIPNSFTPNGDGKNDVFKVVGEYYRDLEMFIYDRWGLLIFESKDSSGWNGKFKGLDCQQGVYVYVIRWYGYTNIIKQSVGHVSLIR